MKRKLYFWAKKYINSENMKVAVMLVPIVIILVSQFLKKEFDWTELVDIGILVSFMLLAISEVLVKAIQKNVAKNTEDFAKLTVDYKNLIKKYSCTNLVTYQGTVFPEQCLCMRVGGEKIVVEDKKDKYYNLPSQIADNSKELMEAHSASTIYNQINVRLDDISLENNCIILNTSRTHFFDSLITNRCCDYVFSNRRTTIREIYEPGPFIKPLSASKLSNHLGFNGFVITKDGKIPFILRKNQLSIAKSTWATSIGASLKTKYALHIENDYLMTTESLGRAIVGEIRDELKISQDGALTEAKAVEGIFAFYRDLVEGGKPQFLFLLQLEDIESEELRGKIEQNSSSAKNDVSTDGSKVVFYTIDELKTATLEVDKMIIAGYKYAMMPSAVASIALLLEYIEKQ